MNALEIKNLRKSFDNFTLDNLTFTLPGGCIMGLIGENGAGKSTTVKLILDILHKDSGSIEIFGKDNKDNICLTKADVGVVTDEIGIPECLNIKQIGNIMKYTFHNWDEKEYYRLVEKLNVPTDKAFKDFSRGNKMKIGIVIALSHNAKLLLLDEPTSGLDPVVRDEVVEIFYDFTKDEEHSVLISSHIVSDLEKLCDYVAFLHKGKLLLFEEKDKLLEEYAIIHCSAQKLDELDNEAVKYKKVWPYGAEAIVKRDLIPHDMPVSPVSIEELFVVMAKEAE